MRKLFLIASNNIKKKKSDVTVLLCLIALAVMLLYVSISILAGNGRVQEEAYLRVNAPDVEYVMAGGREETLARMLEERQEVEDLEVSEALLLTAKYYGTVNPDEKEFMFLLGDVEEERRIGRIYTEELGEQQEDSILLPYYFKCGLGYQIGDEVSLYLGNRYYDFTVQGFVQDPIYASPLNVSIYRCYLPGDYLARIKEEQKSMEAFLFSEYKVKLQAGVSSYQFCQSMTPIMEAAFPQIHENIYFELPWEIMRVGNMMMSNISMGLLLTFAVLLIGIILIVIRFSIRNFLEENLRNTGILEAAGYTTAQLRKAVLLEIGLISGAGSVLGILLGIASGDVVRNLQAAFTGLPWSSGFDWGAAGAAVFGSVGICLAITAGVTRIYKKITVLEALRDGIPTHSFKRNYLPLHKSILPLPVNLGMKNILVRKVRSLSILLIVLLLSMISCIGFGMYQNFAQDSNMLLMMSGIEMGSLQIGTNQEVQVSAGELEQVPGVERVLAYANSTIKLKEGEKEWAIACDYWNEPELLENVMLLEGRLPRYDNEIVVTSNVADRWGIHVGDVLYVEGKEGKLDFLVSGIDQKMNNMGIKAMMNYEGMMRLNGEMGTSALFVYAKEGVSYEAVATAIADRWPDLQIINSKEVAQGSINVVILVMKVLCSIFAGVTLLVVFLVIFLLVQSQVIREKKNYGIQKALGFTTGGLVWQTVLGNVPVLALGAFLGALLAPLTAEPIAVTCMSVFGIKKLELGIDIHWLVLTVAGVILTGLVTAILCSLKIRKVEPVRMIIGE